MGRRESEKKLERDGFECYGCEYDGDAQKRQAILERNGYETRVLRERTDTKGLKMYSVWMRKGA